LLWQCKHRTDAFMHHPDDELMLSIKYWNLILLWLTLK